MKKRPRRLRLVKPGEEKPSNPLADTLGSVSMEQVLAVHNMGPEAIAATIIEQSEALLGRLMTPAEIRSTSSSQRVIADCMEDIADQREALAEGKGLRLVSVETAKDRRRKRLLSELAEIAREAPQEAAEVGITYPFSDLAKRASARLSDLERDEEIARFWHEQREALGQTEEARQAWNAMISIGAARSLTLGLVELTKERPESIGEKASCDCAPKSPNPEAWASSSVPSAPVALTRGTVVNFRKGDRVTWTDPCGLGGTQLSGIFLGARVDASGTSWAVGIDAEPSESLRALAAEIGISMSEARPAAPFGMPWPATRAKSGLDGNGGLLVVTYEAFESAVREGRLVLVAETPGSKPLPGPTFAQFKAYIERKKWQPIEPGQGGGSRWLSPEEQPVSMVVFYDDGRGDIGHELAVIARHESRTVDEVRAEIMGDGS